MVTVNRRRFLTLGGTGAVIGLTGLAGCSSNGSSPSECSGEQRTDVKPPAIGTTDAPHTVEVFSDYACSHCATFELAELPDIFSNLVQPGQLIYVHRDFPLPISKWSWLIPNVARAVQQSIGIEAYIGFNEAIYRNQEQYSEDLVSSKAVEVGLERSRVQDILSNQPYCSAIKADRERAQEFGIEGTPTAVVDGSTIVKGPTFEKIEQAIS